MIIAGVILLLVYSLVIRIRSPHFKRMAVLSALTLLCMVPGYLWCREACFYIVLLNILIQSVYFARLQGDSLWSCVLQCGVYLLPAVVWSILLAQGAGVGAYEGVGEYVTAGESLSVGENLTAGEYNAVWGEVAIASNTGYAVLVEVLLFIAVQMREEAVRRRFENYSVAYQNKLLRNQVEEVQHIYMTMRGWRHDYHNHLQSLKAKLSQNRIEESIQYLDELEKDLDDIHQIVESGNVNVDAILNSKLSLAIAQDIDVNVKVAIPNKLPLSDIDCCVLLGNLIDNAIEACEKVQDKKYIRLYIGIHKKQLYMSITNATNEVVRKFDEEYITTKRGNHGHGLKRINKVVEKYNGYINRKNEPGVFVCEIMLPMPGTARKQ